MAKALSPGPARRAAPPLLVIGSVALGQSLLGALTFQGVPTLMRGAGVPLDVVALSYLAMAPWALKILWSAPVERLRLPATGERRSRGILLCGQAAVAALVAALALAGPGVPALAIALLALAALASATTDIAGDGFAVDRASAGAERARVSAVQIGGAYLGMVAGAGGLLLAVPRLGWTGSLVLVAGLVAVLALPALFMDEPARPREIAAAQRPSLARALASRPARTGLLAVLALQLGPRIAQALAGPRMVDLGLDPAAVGSVFLGGAVMALAASLAAGRLGARLAPARLLGLAAALQAGAAALLALGAGALAPFVAGVLVFSAANGFGFVALYAWLMGRVSPRQAGVDFTLFQSADAAIALVCGLCGGLLAARFGYGASFAVALAAALGGLAALPALLRPAFPEETSP